MHPTPAQLAVLRTYQVGCGRVWKSHLRLAWETGDYRPYAKLSSPLQQLRNEFGPVWLRAYRVGDTKVAYTAPEAQPAAGGGTQLAYYLREPWAPNTALAGPFATKAQARAAARAFRITILEY